MQPKFFQRFSVKLILIISGIILLNLFVYTFYNITKLKKDLTATETQNAYNISDIIKKSTRRSMSLNRREDIYHIINTIGTEQGVEKIRIYDKRGVISYSTDSLEVGQIVDTKDESCAVCHSRTDLPATLPMNEMIRIYTVKPGKKVLGLINPIRNEKDCYTAECHVHEKDKEILGVLDVMMSTQKMDNIIDANIQSTITNAVLLTILISISLIGFITMLVNRPLSQIQKGIGELSDGNLDYKIKVKTKDELGNVAYEFNNMAVKLDTAYKEIKDWNETLNNKVKEKNEELKKIYEQITQIEKLASLGTLSATVAHELNNPLEGILTYSKLIAKKIGKEPETEENKKNIKFLNLISDESARCGKIVKDLLLFSKEGEGEYSFCSIQAILERSLIIINHHLELNKINLVKSFAPVEVKAECDSQKIEQALIAILMNAVEAMNEGGRLEVKLSFNDTEAIIRVIDQGKGISEKDLPHIFEPFFSTKGGNKGTGLGLAVAYGIIIKHKGRILVEETSLNGTTFKITLPLTKKSKEKQNEQQSEYSYS
ncbi:MAG TPA: ATP-binding protein [Ignavibacteriaceae bacterium]|nr:ATP-binding protein [Ignavibacteriaceae bacterium]